MNTLYFIIFASTLHFFLSLASLYFNSLVWVNGIWILAILYMVNFNKPSFMILAVALIWWNSVLWTSNLTSHSVIIIIILFIVHALIDRYAPSYAITFILVSLFSALSLIFLVPYVWFYTLGMLGVSSLMGYFLCRPFYGRA